MQCLPAKKNQDIAKVTSNAPAHHCLPSPLIPTGQAPAAVHPPPAPAPGPTHLSAIAQQVGLPPPVAPTPGLTPLSAAAQPGGQPPHLAPAPGPSPLSAAAQQGGHSFM